MERPRTLKKGRKKGGIAGGREQKGRKRVLQSMKGRALRREGGGRGRETRYDCWSTVGKRNRGGAEGGAGRLTKASTNNTLWGKTEPARTRRTEINAAHWITRECLALSGPFSNLPPLLFLYYIANPSSLLFQLLLLFNSSPLPLPFSSSPSQQEHFISFFSYSLG